MKKLLPLVLVLAMASLASAATVDFYGNGTSGLVTVNRNAAVTITVIADFEVANLVLTIGADDGSAALGTLHTKLVTMPMTGYLRNGTGTGTTLILIDRISGSQGVTGAITGPVPANAALYTFTYTAPGVDGDYDIFSVVGSSQFPPPPPYGCTVAGVGGVPTLNTVGALTVTVIPEPMTIALLGLGGLFLLRRRK